jgi:hypothetical protein
VKRPSAKFVWAFLNDIEPGITVNGSRGKTLTVINRVWVSVLERTKAFEASGAQSGGRCIG